MFASVANLTTALPGFLASWLPGFLDPEPENVDAGGGPEPCVPAYRMFASRLPGAWNFFSFPVAKTTTSLPSTFQTKTSQESHTSWLTLLDLR
jgi:hypothetical protein